MLRAGKHALKACELEELEEREGGAGVDTAINAALKSEERAATWQLVTFVASLVVQVGVLIFSWVSIAEYDVPYLLFVAMLLEAIVQTVEFVAYLIMGLVALLTHASVGVEWRYLDWAVTTPTMLISLYMLIQYFWTPCESDELQRSRFTDDSVLPAVLPLIIVFDWAMLASGFVVEYDTSRAVKRLGRRAVQSFSCGEGAGAAPPVAKPRPILTSWPWFPVLVFAYFNPLSWVVACQRGFGLMLEPAPGTSLAAQSASYRRWYLGFGFVFLVVAFVSHFAAIRARPSVEGVALTFSTFLVWIVYGVVAIGFTPRGSLDPQRAGDEAVTYVRATTTLMWKNVWYNMLDLLSKNSTGILVSIVAANYDKSKLDCSS